MKLLWFSLGLAFFLYFLEVLFPIVRRPRDWKRRWPLNLLTTIFLSSVMTFLTFSSFFAAGIAHEKGWGLCNQISGPFFVVILVTFLARSFAGWFTHVLHHRIPFLWRFHLSHHSDHYIDITTSGRFHVLECLIGTAGAMAMTVAFGISQEATMVYEISWIIWNNVSHANVRLPVMFERVATIIFHTPANHRVHHSRDPRDYNCNYGVVLSVWDHLFGTHKARVEIPEEELRVGVPSVTEESALSYWKVNVVGFADKARVKA